MLFVIGVLLCVAGSASGQEADPGPDDESHVYVRIETNVPDALLFADSTFVDRASAGLIAVPAFTKRIRLVIRDVESWSIPPVEKPMRAAPGDTVAVILNFDYHYRVESVPFGAGVHLEQDGERKHLGSTPLLHTSRSPLDGRFAVERSGYATERIDPGSDIWNRHVVSLSPSEEVESGVARVNWTPPRKHRQWIDYAALGTAVVAGAFAVHYKFKADRLYSEYEDSADASLRPDIHAYDVRSGIAFGVMQVGVGVFAVRLFLR